MINVLSFFANSTYVARSNRTASRKQIHTVAVKLQEKKESVCVAPEGTRSKTGLFTLPLKKGWCHQLLPSTPAYMLCIRNGFELWPYGSKFPASICPTPGVLPCSISGPCMLKDFDSMDAYIKHVGLTMSDRLLQGCPRGSHHSKWFLLPHLVVPFLLTCTFLCLEALLGLSFKEVLLYFVLAQVAATGYMYAIIKTLGS